VEIATWINETLNEWQLINKIVCITTDNGTNMIKAIQLTGYRNIRCFAHSTNIGVSKIFKNESFNDLIVKAKQQRSLLANSNKFKRLFKNKNSDDSYLTIPSDVTTRWWSTYHMLLRCLQLKEKMNEPLNKYENGKFRKYKFNESEVKIITNINGLLSIVKERIEYICGENYVTASIILPMIDTIYE
jgi:ssDNA-specific exonuclease RecJ